MEPQPSLLSLYFFSRCHKVMNTTFNATSGILSTRFRAGPWFTRAHNVKYTCIHTDVDTRIAWAKAPQMHECTVTHTHAFPGSRCITGRFLSPLWKITIRVTRLVSAHFFFTLGVDGNCLRVTHSKPIALAGPHKSKTPDENPILGFYTKEVNQEATPPIPRVTLPHVMAKHPRTRWICRELLY